MLIQLKDITAGYQNSIVLRNVNLTVNPGDYIGVIGPNGGGKTTLLKVILGIIKPQSGKVIFGDKIRLSKEKTIGYLPQLNDFDKRFPVSVTDIVLSGFLSGNAVLHRYTKQERERAHFLMKKMGIENIRKKPAGEISGGQLQRALLSRALASNPEILILDEPNTYVDNKFEHELYENLKAFNEEGKAIILVTHDVGTISYYIKSIACVNETLFFHPSNIITEKQLATYNCPIQIITHGDIPHTVLKTHTQSHE
ncbi:MAG: ABC transporter ATP-binding protein [Bacteroidia bacterium]|nr:ABC transporter ATP-binding protein [Bacteroidia bacterium]